MMHPPSYAKSENVLQVKPSPIQQTHSVQCKSRPSPGSRAECLTNDCPPVSFIFKKKKTRGPVKHYQRPWFCSRYTPFHGWWPVWMKQKNTCHMSRDTWHGGGGIMGIWGHKIVNSALCQWHIYLILLCSGQTHLYYKWKPQSSLIPKQRGISFVLIVKLCKNYIIHAWILLWPWHIASTIDAYILFIIVMK